MLPDGACSPQRSQAVLVYGRRLIADLRQIVHLVLMQLERAHRQERDRLVEHRLVASHAHVVVDNVWKPGEVVGKPSPDASSAVWVPPVLDITFDELSCGCAEDVVARDARFRV